MRPAARCTVHVARRRLDAGRHTQEGASSPPAPSGPQLAVPCTGSDARGGAGARRVGRCEQPPVRGPSTGTAPPGAPTLEDTHRVIAPRPIIGCAISSIIRSVSTAPCGPHRLPERSSTTRPFVAPAAWPSLVNRSASPSASEQWPASRSGHTPGLAARGPSPPLRHQRIHPPTHQQPGRGEQHGRLGPELRAGSHEQGRRWVGRVAQPARHEHLHEPRRSAPTARSPSSRRNDPRTPRQHCARLRHPRRGHRRMHR